MEMMDEVAKWNFAVWLRRRYTAAQRRLNEADAIVLASGVSEKDLREEWDAQVQTQLVKQPRELVPLSPYLIVVV